MKVSIITVCYNSQATIEKTIQSVISQTYKDIEYIIVDGNSADNTKDIINRYSGKISIFISEPDEGLYYAMNKGINLATGDVVGILNSDDFYVDESVIEKVVNCFTPATDAVYGDIMYVDRSNVSEVKRYWRSGSFSLQKMKFGWMPPHPGFFVRRSAYKQHGVFNTSFVASADYELMFRLIYKHHIRLAYLPQVLVKMRDGGLSNTSFAQRLKANREDSMAWKINGFRIPFFFRLLKPLRKLPQFLKMNKS